MINAAIFDMDGVIINSEPIHDIVWKEFFDRHDISVSREDLDSMRGIPPAATIRKFMPQITDAVVLDDLHKERAEILTHAFIHNTIPLVAGVSEFMQDLQRQGISIAVATSTLRDIARDVLQKVGIYNFVDVLVGGDEIVHGKPHPEIFLTAAKKLEKEPADCVVFEDSLAGVEAARSAEMCVVAVLTTHPKEAFPNTKYFLNNFQVDATALLEKVTL